MHILLIKRRWKTNRQYPVMCSLFKPWTVLHTQYNCSGSSKIIKKRIETFCCILNIVAGMKNVVLADNVRPEEAHIPLRHPNIRSLGENMTAPTPTIIGELPLHLFRPCVLFSPRVFYGACSVAWCDMGIDNATKENIFFLIYAAVCRDMNRCHIFSFSFPKGKVKPRFYL